MIIGDTQVGKTSLLQKFVQGNSQEKKSCAMPFYNVDKLININGKRIMLHLWDISIEENAHSQYFLTKQMIQKQKGFMLVFDITKPESLASLTKWYRLIQEKTLLEDKQAPIFLISTKSDVNEHSKQISKKMIDEWIDDNQVTQYIETSVNLGKNVDRCFKNLVKQILKSNLIYDSNISSSSILKCKQQQLQLLQQLQQQQQQSESKCFS